MKVWLTMVRLLLAAVALGAALAVVTKGLFELFLWIIDLLWDWLPDRIGADPGDIWYLAVVLGVGGLLVGLGNRYLGYEPRPLEVVADELSEGKPVEHRTIPRSLANSVASLGFGGPLGPEAVLISVVGGLYYWVEGRMQDLARTLFSLITGRAEEDAGRPWRYAPSVIAAASLVVVFRELPGGVDLSFVPVPDDPAGVSRVVTAAIAGLAGGLLGMFSSRLHTRVRGFGLFTRSPELVGVAGGLLVAMLASESLLVLFSGAEEVSALFDGTLDAGAMTYAGVAKWLGLVIVLGAGWKGGPIFPLMFTTGALAIAVGDTFGLDGVIIYAGGIAGVVAGALRSIPFGVVVALLVVPPSLLVPLIVGAAAAGVALRVETMTPSPRES